MAHLCPCYSVVPEGWLRALEGGCVSSKSSSRVKDRNMGVAGMGGTTENSVSDEGSLICLPVNLALLHLNVCDPPDLKLKRDF